MLKKIIKALAFPLIALVIGVFASVLQYSQSAYSQSDYEEYIIMEDVNQQSISQRNIGSGSSTNINCATNTAGTNLLQSVPTTCPTVPDNGNNGLLPRLVVTQRSAPDFTTSTVTSTIPENWAVSTAVCNNDEVVTGGGWEFDPSRGLSGNEEIIMEKATGNGWSVYVWMSGLTFKAHAECAKLVP